MVDPLYRYVSCIQGRSQEFATGNKTGCLRDGSPPAGSRGRARWGSGPGEAPEAGDKCYFPATTGEIHPCPPLGYATAYIIPIPPPLLVSVAARAYIKGQFSHFTYCLRRKLWGTLFGWDQILRAAFRQLLSFRSSIAVVVYRLLTSSLIGRHWVVLPVFGRICCCHWNWLPSLVFGWLV